MENSTSVGYKNFHRERVEDFLHQLPPLRNLGASPWEVKCEARHHNVAKFGWLEVNYSASNIRKDTALLAQGNREDIQAIAHDLRRFVLDPTTQSFTASCTFPLSHNRNAHRTIDPTKGEARNYHGTKYDKNGNRTVARFTNEAQSKGMRPPND